MIELKEKIQGPYHFDGILQRLALDPLNNVDLDNREIKIPVYLELANIPVTVKATGTIENPEFQVTFEEQAGVPAAAVKHEVERFIPMEHQYGTNSSALSEY